MRVVEVHKRTAQRCELCEDNVGENDSDDIKTTIMNPDTRTLIRVNISDIENDSRIFQMLRGGTVQDQMDRKFMMKAFVGSRDIIDT